MRISMLWAAIGLSLIIPNGVAQNDPDVSAADVLDIISSPQSYQQTLSKMSNNWHPGYAMMLLEVSRFTRSQPFQFALAKLLQDKLEIRPSAANDLYQGVWAKPYEPHPEYGAFKAQLYNRIDKRFSEYFENSRSASAKIRQDEIRWGGVIRDGIPPLKNPKMLKANKAKYLSDSDVVFGIEINGDTRAYPKRILAWHEMFKDTVGGKSINGVYCTLCGSLIIYDTVFKGTHYELGTSGFLYRSNKLMYDHATKSMWNTLTGEPVLGPLVDKGIKLNRSYVVTTTWGEWKKRHPNTIVLSLATGHSRDYGEGVAYRDYFNTDELMFDVPNGLKDKTIKNKAEIVGLVDSSGVAKPLAIHEKFLANQPVYQKAFSGKNLVILTDSSGANRVYDVGDHQIVSWDGDHQAKDSNGEIWTVSESSLQKKDATISLPRFPAHRAFWFGWKAAFPNTQLIHEGNKG